MASLWLVRWKNAKSRVSIVPWGAPFIGKRTVQSLQWPLLGLSWRGSVKKVEGYGSTAWSQHVLSPRRLVFSTMHNQGVVAPRPFTPFPS